jgi:integrase
MTLKRRHLMFLRGNVYYVEDTETRKQTSLGTRDKRTAERLVLAKNEATEQPLMNLSMARTYLAAHDPRMVTRTWANVIAVFSSNGRESTRQRCERAFASTPFDSIRNKALVETNGEDILNVLKIGGTSTNNYMRGLHNLALNLGWLAWPILVRKVWPKIRYKVRRAITQAEHERIIASESSTERRLYYEMLWETGGSQSDIANLSRDNLDQVNDVLFFQRQKLPDDSQPARIRIGKRLREILDELPKTGYFFPTIRKTPARHRSAEFWRRCQILKIRGVSLHSYRYAWAERAKDCGYPERFAMVNLGHNSPAIHRAYAKRAKVICPPLEEYEKAARPSDAVAISAQGEPANVAQWPSCAA